MPMIPLGEREAYKRWAKGVKAPLPDKRHWVHESDWAAYLQDTE